MATRVKLHECEALVELPPGDGPAPGIVVIQEYWGLNAWVEQITREWAAAGFVAVAPDLYGGKVAKTAEEAGAMMKAMDWGQATAKVAAAVSAARTQPRSNGKVAVVGYCMGGALALAAATQLPDLAAVIPFYGLPGELDWTQVTAPIQGHYCEGDAWATIEGARQIARSVPTQMDVFTYQAHHAFCNATRPEVYDAAAAKLAFSRATEFARAHAR